MKNSNQHFWLNSRIFFFIQVDELIFRVESVLRLNVHAILSFYSFFAVLLPLLFLLFSKK